MHFSSGKYRESKAGASGNRKSCQKLKSIKFMARGVPILDSSKLQAESL